MFDYELGEILAVVCQEALWRVVVAGNRVMS